MSPPTETDYAMVRKCKCGHYPEMHGQNAPRCWAVNWENGRTFPCPCEEYRGEGT